MEDAEDIVQQAFADIWEKNKEDISIVNMKSYLFQTVKNRSLNLIAKSSLLQTVDEYPDIQDMTEEEAVASAEQDARLWEAIDHLPTERKRIFLLSKRDGLKYQEIANQLHISVKTVENQMGKALKSLRETVVRIYLFFFG